MAAQALDLQPEDPGLGLGGKSGGTRNRLLRFAAAALRLAVAAAVGMPNSVHVRRAAASFVEAHRRALLRMLHEAASPGTRG